MLGDPLLYLYCQFGSRVEWLPPGSTHPSSKGYAHGPAICPSTCAPVCVTCTPLPCMSLSNSRALTPFASLAGGSFILKVLFFIESKCKIVFKLSLSPSTASSSSFVVDFELIGLTCDGATARSGDEGAAGRRRTEGAAAEGEEGQPGEENEEAPVGGKERRGGAKEAAAVRSAAARSSACGAARAVASEPSGCRGREEGCTCTLLVFSHAREREGLVGQGQGWLGGANRALARLG